MPRVLVTGATGLVGRVLCPRLAESGYTLRAALRSDTAAPSGVAERVVIGDITRPLDWSFALDNVDLVVHAAARTHIGRGDPNGLPDMAADVFASSQLAAAAARHGVRRFVYLSSIKANGEDSGSQPFSADSVPHPVDPYGRSKLQGEAAVREAAGKGRMEVVILRPPLIYGPGVQANFLRLMRWVDRERLLPLGAINNRRSLVSAWNLSALIVNLLEHPAAGGAVWLVSDGEDVSTPQLIRRLATAMGRRARLLSVPPQALRLCAALVGRGSDAARLCGSLAVDSSLARNVLGWVPALSLDEGLQRMATWYRRGAST